MKSLLTALASQQTNKSRLFRWGHWWVEVSCYHTSHREGFWCSELDKCYCQLSPISVDERIHDSGYNWQTKEQITTNSLRLLRQVFLVTRHRAVTPEPEFKSSPSVTRRDTSHKERVLQCHKESTRRDTELWHLSLSYCTYTSVIRRVTCHVSQGETQSYDTRTWV